MKESGIARDRTVMIGDSSVDVHTARNAKVLCCCVTYGFQPESLAEPKPDALFDRMEDVAGWILASGANT